ncbi:hypothetical protein ACQKOH_23320 [Sphingomonas sp. NPDC092331]|jgi:hypothetical protein|uniref:hypothetical protein n=1 Tax=unclassified Sphingomonas TaxID=196159 RepID=UPI003812B1E5
MSRDRALAVTGNFSLRDIAGLQAMGHRRPSGRLGCVKSSFFGLKNGFTAASQKEGISAPNAKRGRIVIEGMNFWVIIVDLLTSSSSDQLRSDIAIAFRPGFVAAITTMDAVRLTK